MDRLCRRGPGEVTVCFQQWAPPEIQSATAHNGGERSRETAAIDSSAGADDGANRRPRRTRGYRVIRANHANAAKALGLNA